MAAAAVEADSPRSRAVEPRPLIAKAATIQRPVRAGESTGQHVVAGRLGRRVSEFEPWRLPRTFRRREKLTLVDDHRRGARGGSCPGGIPDNCHLSCL